MIEHLSASSIGMASRCGEQFKQRYIMGWVAPPGIAKARGSAVHKAAEVNFSQKIITHQDLPEDVLLDAARDTYVRRLQQGVHLVKQDQAKKAQLINEGLNVAIRATRALHGEIAPQIQPEATEERIMADIGLDVPLLGYLDVRDLVKIHEFKTSKLSWNRARAATEIQPPAYRLLGRELGLDLSTQFHIMVPQEKRVKIQTPTAAPDENQLQSFVNRGQLVLDMVRAGIYPPAYRSAWWCAPKWCGYFYSCKFTGNPSQSWV